MTNTGHGSRVTGHGSRSLVANTTRAGAPSQPAMRNGRQVNSYAPDATPASARFSTMITPAASSARCTGSPGASYASIEGPSIPTKRTPWSNNHAAASGANATQVGGKRFDDPIGVVGPNQQPNRACRDRGPIEHTGRERAPTANMHHPGRTDQHVQRQDVHARAPQQEVRRSVHVGASMTAHAQAGEHRQIVAHARHMDGRIARPDSQLVRIWAALRQSTCAA